VCLLSTSQHSTAPLRAMKAIYLYIYIYKYIHIYIFIYIHTYIHTSRCGRIYRRGGHCRGCVSRARSHAASSHGCWSADGRWCASSVCVCVCVCLCVCVCVCVRRCACSCFQGYHNELVKATCA
jgi:hypothetical protein